ncbi:MAG: YciI family protein [Chitinophaga rupis]
MAAAEERRKEVAANKAEQKAAAEERKKEVAAKKAAAIAKKKEEASKRRAEKLAAAQEKSQPSLFVISLRYLVPLEKIDAAMSKHVTYLDKYFASGVFLMSGRQVPRMGGVIIARGKNRNAIERITRQDPFVKGKLARVDIVEFKGSKVGKLEVLL